MNGAARSRGRIGALVVRAAAAFVLLAGALGAAPAGAQDRRQNEAGAFDFYVLSLSWSPSFCEEATRQQPNSASTRQQCGARPYAFVVHGLWPQYERGFPEYCSRDERRPDRNTIGNMLDLMPSTGLIFHQWRRHGVCSGLSVRAYFDQIRRARARVKIPEEYLQLTTHKTVTPAAVEEAFVRANHGLTHDAVSVNCTSGRRLSEVRICMSKDLAFRPCQEVDRRACRTRQVVMPPVRLGAAATTPVR
ncbi:MAG TPA: ribonuclease T2 [Xanthobacteraceae bacterium]|nr:ribonuclease T2 [Xanthobacteraceae bacterium]